MTWVKHDNWFTVRYNTSYKKEVERLAKQTIQQVVDAEARAKQIRIDYHAQVEHARHEQRAKIKALTQSYDDEAKAYDASKQAEVNTAFETYRTTANEKHQGDLAHLKREFEQKKSDLVSFVVEEVRKSYGNS